MTLTRRQFLKFTGTGALALSAMPLFDRPALAKYLSESAGGEQVGVLVDTTRCVGCRACQAACKKKNNLPADPENLPAGKTFPAKLSASTFSLVEFYQVGGTSDKPKVQPVKKQCMHCLTPACASVCPVGAIQKTAKGPVTYDADKCMGCRYCMVACPFGVPKFEWDSANPRIRKCNLCADRIEQGQMPACVQACPMQALTFGTRAELVAEAQARVSKSPDKYVSYIYGLAEVGGTSVLYLANVPFDKLAFNTELPTHPLPENTAAVMEKIPGLAVGVALALSGVSWWNHRKEKNNE